MVCETISPFPITFYCIYFLLAIFEYQNVSSNFVKFENYEYYIERNNSVKSYAHAEVRCAAMENATLAVIKTKEVNSFLMEEIGNFSALHTSPYSFYIGLTRLGNSNEFKWIDKTWSSDGFVNWYKNEPNNGSLNSNPENCVNIGWRYTPGRFGYQWADVPCTDWSSLYICQKPIESIFIRHQSTYSTISIAIPVIGVALFIAIFIFVFFICRKRIKSNHTTNIPQPMHDTLSSTTPTTPEPVNNIAYHSFMREKQPREVNNRITTISEQSRYTLYQTIDDGNYDHPASAFNSNDLSNNFLYQSIEEARQDSTSSKQTANELYQSAATNLR